MSTSANHSETPKCSSPLAVIRAQIERLDAWMEGERHAQVSAEERRDRHAAEGHYNTIRNYQAMRDSLADALDDLT